MTFRFNYNNGALPSANIIINNNNNNKNDAGLGESKQTGKPARLGFIKFHELQESRGESCQCTHKHTHTPS